MTRVLIHAEVELGAIDGSTSWLISISRCFAMAGADVDVMARNVPSRAIVLDELRSHPRVRVVYPNSNPTNEPATVADAIVARHTRSPYDVIVVRGERTGRRLIASPSARAVLWYYLVGLPSITDAPFENRLSHLREIARLSRGLFAQTPWLRDYLYALLPEAVGKTHVLPPMVPDAFFTASRARRPGPLRLGYAGKFDRPWHTLEIPELVGLLRQRGIESSITMHGDKVQAAKSDPTWHVRMRELMAEPPSGVRFPGALPRSEIATFMMGCDLGIGWRDSALDTSYEISTKMLEFSASRVPVVCNDTAIHRAILGDDYPLLVRDDITDVARAIEQLDRSPESLASLGDRVSAAVAPYSFAATARRLRELLSDIGAHGSITTAPPSHNAYVHVPGYASGAVIHALSTISATEVRSVKRAAGSSAWLSAAGTVFTDFDRRALEAIPEDVGPPIVAYAAGGRDEYGLVNPHRTARLSAILSPDADLLRRVAAVAPRCSTMLIDPTALAPTLLEDGSAGPALHLSIAVTYGDVRGARELRDSLPAALHATKDRCRVRVVLIRPWEWDGEDATEAHDFSRALHHALVGVGTADMELLVVSRHDQRWMRETALLVALGQVRREAGLVRQCAGYGASILGPIRTAPAGGEAIVVAQRLTPAALDAALDRRRSAVAVVRDQQGRLATFLDGLRRSATRTLASAEPTC